MIRYQAAAVRILSTAAAAMIDYLVVMHTGISCIMKLMRGGILKKKENGVTEDEDESPDTLIGGMGKDYLDGGKGNDVLYEGEATVSAGFCVRELRRVG